MRALWQWIHPDGCREIDAQEITLSCSLRRTAGATWVTIDGLGHNDGESIGFDLFDLLDEIGLEVGLAGKSGRSRLVRRIPA